MTNGWIYQGRQQHGWFGHGTAPGVDPLQPDPHQSGGTLARRIHDLGHVLIAGLPQNQRHHDAVRLSVEDHARLDRILTAVVQALPQGLPTVANRIFGKPYDTPGLAGFARAATLLRDGRDNADLRAAADALGQAAMDIGLDRFKGLLRQADDHVTRQGGFLTLVRDMPVSTSPAVAGPTPESRIRSPLPPQDQWAPFLSKVFRRAGWLSFAGAALGALMRSNRDTQIRDAAERFHLDPASAADMAAASAFVWARSNRALLLGTSLPESAQDDVAEQVMRAVQSDPTLLDHAISGDKAALDAIRSAVRRVAVRDPRLGLALVTDPNDPDEQALVTLLQSQGKSAAEIQVALDAYRRSKKPLTATERRNTPGTVIVSRDLPALTGLWLNEAEPTKNGATIPRQVAEKLKGKTFSSFGALRAAIWRAVSATPDLARQFQSLNVARMRVGKAPLTTASVFGKWTRVWELHHDPYIGEGGLVYDLSTIRVVLPNQHDQIHGRER